MSNMNPIKFTNPNYNLINTTSKTNNTTTPEKINIDISEIVEKIGDKTKDFFSNNNESTYEKNMSDKESLNLNKIGGFINDLENKLTKEELNIVINYYQGKTISDIIDENGNLKPISLDNSNTNDINNKIKDIKINGYESIIDCKISEIVCDSSGYNAIVLVNAEGNYYINSSQTNPKNKNDLSSIMYSLLGYLYDDSLAKYLPSFFFPSTDSNYSNAEDVYNAQLNASYELIKKYSKKAEQEDKSVDLFGFSLGGGITTTAYSLMKIKDEKLTDNINSVSVYNPYLLYADGYSEFKPYLNIDDDNITFKNFLKGWLYTGNPLLSIINLLTSNTNAGFSINGKSLMNAISNDEKVTIYSAESDIVSTLNDYYPKLKERFTIIPAKEIEIDIKNTGISYGNLLGDLFTGKGLDINSEIDNIKENSLSNVLELYAFIIGGKGNHGFGCISDELFDEKGNLIKKGDYQNINELFAKLFNKSYSGNKESVDLPFVMDTILKGSLPIDLFLQYKSIILENVDIGDIDISNVDFEKILNYIINNAGNFSKTEFLNIVGEEFSNWLGSDEGIEFILSKLNSSIPDNKLIEIMLNYAIEEAKVQEDLVDTFVKIIKNKDNFDIVMQSILMIYQGNSQLGMQTLSTMLLNDFDVVKEDLVDIVCDTMEDLLNEEEMQNLICKQADNFLITLSIDKLEVGDNVIRGFKEILKDNDDMVDEIINQLQENPEIINNPENLIKKMLKIVQPEIEWNKQFWLWVASLALL